MKPTRQPDGQEPMAVQRHLEQVNKVLSNISFGDTMGNADRSQNIECWKAVGTSPAGANTEFAVSHGLGRVPITIAGQDTNNGGVVYRSGTPWTATQVFLKCTTVSAGYNLILI